MRTISLDCMNARAVEGGILVEVHVKPSSKNDSVIVSDEILVATKKPPEHGKANVAAVKLLANELGVPAASIRIVRGSLERHKLFLIRGLSLDDFGKKLARSTK